MKLGLGTAQFGLPYGISNRLGQTPESEVEKILNYAKLCQIQVLDTATAYGTSESVIGRRLTQDHSFKIVTKVPKGSLPYQLSSIVQKSLERMDQPSVYGLLLHHS